MQTNAAAVVHPENYLIYDFIQSLPGVLSSPLLYIFDNIVMILWFSGVQIILFLAAGNGTLRQQSFVVTHRFSSSHRKVWIYISVYVCSNGICVHPGTTINFKISS